MADRALPDLVARARLDTTQWDAAYARIQASLTAIDASTGKLATSGAATAAALDPVQRIVGGQSTAARDLEKAQTDLNQVSLAGINIWGQHGRAVEDTKNKTAALESGTKSITTTHKGHSAALKDVSGGLSDVKGWAEKTGEALGVVERTTSNLGAAEGRLGRASSLLGGTGLPLLGGIAALIGIPAVLDVAAEHQEKYAATVLRTAEVTGLSTTMTQALGHAMDATGVGQENLQRYVGMFNRNLAEGAPALSKAGVDLKTLGITSHDTGEAFLQAADYIHTHQNAMENAAIAQALFGRGGQQLLPILAQGRQFFADYTAELEKYGVILTGQQLGTAAFANTAREQFGLALQGIENQFIAPLQEGFALLWTSLTKELGGASQAANSFGEVIAHVLVDIVSFLNGMFGLNISLKDLSDTLNSPSAQLSGLSQNAQDAGTALDGTTLAVKDNTEAIQNQIQALQDQQKATDEQYDSETRLLQADENKLSLQKQLIDQARTLADDQRRVTKDQQDLALATWQGNYQEVSRLGDQLTSDKQKQADDQEKANIDAVDRELKARQAAVAEEKRVYDDMMADKMRADQEQLRAAQKAIADQTRAWQQGAISNVTATHNAFVDIVKMANEQDPFWKAKGQDFGKWLAEPLEDKVRDAIVGISRLLDPTKDPGKTIVAVAVQLGVAIGIGIAKGIAEAIWTARPDPRSRSAVNEQVIIAQLKLEKSEGRSREQATQDIQAAIGSPPTAAELSAAGYAGGGRMAMGEWAWLGEAGPELGHLTTAGLDVYPSGKMPTASEILGGSGGSLTPITPVSSGDVLGGDIWGSSALMAKEAHDDLLESLGLVRQAHEALANRRTAPVPESTAPPRNVTNQFYFPGLIGDYDLVMQAASDALAGVYHR